MVLVWCLLGTIVFLEEKERAKQREQLWGSTLPPEKRKERGVGWGSCKPMLMGTMHVDNLGREAHFHFEKSSSKGLGPARHWSKIHLLVLKERSMADWSRNHYCFRRRWKRVRVRGGDHGVAFLRAPTSKGWSCFYGKSLDVDKKVVICTCSNYNHKATHTPQSLSGEVRITELSTATQPGDVMHSCSLSQGTLIPPLY